MSNIRISFANEAFRSGDFGRAREIYSLLEKEGGLLATSARFNLGLLNARAAGGFGANSSVQKEGFQANFSPTLAIPRIKFDNIEEKYYEYKDFAPINAIVKAIAFYLPQFHPFPENDAWWGKGFTEWSNVGKATKNFEGHHQPHCPIHNGYYDLRLPEVMEEQTRLAKNYGIYGFNYYFYWFDGKVLMDRPLRDMLSNKKIDMPFCLTWANENWTRRWDGQDNDVLIAQNHSNEDSLDFIDHLIRYFRDDRYIKVRGCPVLIIYRASIIPKISETAQLWREAALKNGFAGLYLVSAQTFGISSPDPFGFDASMEFPPHTVVSTDVRHNVRELRTDFKGKIYSYEQVVDNAVGIKPRPYKCFSTAMLSWDNTARKQSAGHIFNEFSLVRYKQWLSSIATATLYDKKLSDAEKFVFINAWNEWAEGTHLEPDRKYGYGYLQATRESLENFDATTTLPLRYTLKKRSSEAAIIVHLHYSELWPEIAGYLKKLDDTFDLFVTITDSRSSKAVYADFPGASVRLVENRGRDVLPFIETLREIHGFGYLAICKIHSKRSDYRIDGSKIRSILYESLLGAGSRLSAVVRRLNDNEKLGIIAPERFLIPHTEKNMTFDGELVNSICNSMNIEFRWSDFPAGSMFWFRQAALDRLLLLDSTMFEVEKGLADGTTAHAVERIFTVAARSIGYDVQTMDCDL